jgi:hypothetical protein
MNTIYVPEGTDQVLPVRAINACMEPDAECHSFLPSKLEVGE